MKKFVLGVWVFLIAMIVIGIIVFYITRDLPKTANQFIMEIKNWKYEDAYKYTSSEFQKNVDLESFIQLIENSHIPNNQKINWHSRSIKNWIGDISGNITWQSWSTTPINIQLTKENNLWKIQTINIHSAGIQFDQGALLPWKNEIVQQERNVIMAYKSSFEQIGRASCRERV